MPTLNLAYIAELAFKYIRKFAYLAFLAPFFLAVTAMWTSAVTAFLYFYNLVNSTLLTVSNGSDSSVTLEKFFGLLNCIGITDAYSISSVIFESSLIFLFSSILFKMTLVSYKYYIDAIKTLVV